MRRAVERGVMRPEEHGKKAGFRHRSDARRGAYGPRRVRPTERRGPTSSGRSAGRRARGASGPDDRGSAGRPLCLPTAATEVPRKRTRRGRRGGRAGAAARDRRRLRREKLPTEPRLLEVLARPDGLELGNSVTQFALPLIVFKAHRLGARPGRHARRVHRAAVALRPRDRRMDRSHRPQAPHDRGRFFSPP